MSLLSNAVLLSVLVMAILCVLRLNVLLSIIIAALVAGWLSPFEVPANLIESSAQDSQNIAQDSAPDSKIAAQDSTQNAMQDSTQAIESTQNATQAESTQTQDSIKTQDSTQIPLWQYILLKTTATGETLIKGMASNLNIALSYILLGAIAVAISRTHLMTFLLSAIANVISNRKFIFILSLALIACCSQNLIPIHIAFIPILIPPLLSLMNALRIDRRAVACALTFGLQAPYVTLGVGFGLIFHTTISEQMGANGMPASLSEIASVMWIGGVAMLVGLLFAVFVLYRKPRDYKQSQARAMGEARMGWQEGVTLFGILVLFVVQLLTSSLALGAFAGLMCMIMLGGIKWGEIDSIMEGGLKMMAFIAFVMLVAAGYGEVLRESGQVQSLVDSVVGLMGVDLGNASAQVANMAGAGAVDSVNIAGSMGALDSTFIADSASAVNAGLLVKGVGAFLMLLVGLLITIGIGTSFGTIPIIAAIYVPLGISLGFSAPAIILLIGIAGALGDAGSPASDSTLGPTSGLNMDGQHNHIYDTCIPTFLVYNIPLLLGGVVGAILL